MSDARSLSPHLLARAMNFRFTPASRAAIIAVCLVFVAWAPAPATGTMLVDHYQFENNGDDAAGPDFAHGSLGPGVGFVPGKFGNAALFSANGNSNNQVSVPRADAFDPGGGSFTVAFWARRDENDSGNTDGLLDALNSTTEGYQAQFLNTGAFRMRLDVDGEGFVLLDSINTIPADANFHHVAITIDRPAAQAIIYVNGQPESPLSLAPLGSGTVSPSQDLWIGNINNTTANGFDGALDDLRFYDYALLPGEVLTLSVPEPASFVLWSCCGLALCGYRRWSRRRVRTPGR